MKPKLVYSNGQRVFRARPIRTDYPGQVAHSTTIQAAIVNATKKLLAGVYSHARIYDEAGAHVASVERGRRSIQTFVFKPRKVFK